MRIVGSLIAWKSTGIFRPFSGIIKPYFCMLMESSCRVQGFRLFVESQNKAQCSIITAVPDHRDKSVEIEFFKRYNYNKKTVTTPCNIFNFISDI